MFTKIYRIAGHNVQIKSIFEEIHMQCREYLVEEAPEYTVETTPEDILFEQKKSKDGVVYPESYLETLAVYRKMAEYLLHQRIVLFHGSVVAVDGEGYLFTAKSGTGKSTHTRLWREAFGERAVMINDDKPLLKITDDGVLVYGTPWDGKHRLSTNTVVPLKAICILKRGNQNTIIAAEKREVYPMLLQQMYRPQNGAGMSLALQLLDGIMEHTALYTLHCNMELEAAFVAYQGMNQSGEKNE